MEGFKILDEGITDGYYRMKVYHSPLCQSSSPRPESPPISPPSRITQKLPQKSLHMQLPAAPRSSPQLHTSMHPPPKRNAPRSHPPLMTRSEHKPSALFRLQSRDRWGGGRRIRRLGIREIRGLEKNSRVKTSRSGKSSRNITSCRRLGKCFAEPNTRICDRMMEESELDGLARQHGSNWIVSTGPFSARLFHRALARTLRVLRRWSILLSLHIFGVCAPLLPLHPELPLLIISQLRRFECARPPHSSS